MIDLDTRARQAARGLKQQVSDTAMTLAVPPTERPQQTLLSHPAWSMAAGALAALVLLVGLWVARPAVVADESEEIVVPTSLVTTTTGAAVTTTPSEPVDSVVPAGPPVTNPSTTTEVPADVTPPSIEILSPADGQVFEVKTIVFSGVTEPGARVFGGPYEADVDPEGNWSITLILSPGVNSATFVAVDAAGNEASATVSPVYEPPTTTTKPEELAAFKAFFTFGECAEKPPYDVYYGSGQPGSTVKVISEYGSGETVVGPEGEWELRVEFPAAPLGKVFSVKVKDSLGRYQYFEFVHTEA